MVHFRERDSGFLEAILNRLDGQAGGVLYAIEAFLFDCGEQLAVGDDRGLRVGVVGVDAEDDHTDVSVGLAELPRPAPSKIGRVVRPLKGGSILIRLESGPTLCFLWLSAVFNRFELTIRNGRNSLVLPLFIGPRITLLNIAPRQP